MRLWDIQNGKNHLIGKHEKMIKSVAISKDNKFIVTGSQDTTVRLYVRETGE